MKDISMISDDALLAAASQALHAAAPASPPGLASTIRREAVRRRYLRLFRLSATAVASAAAVAAVAAIFLSETPQVPPSEVRSISAGSAALRMLLCDAEEALALDAATSTSDDSDADATEVDWDCEDFDFAEALLAWQEAPLRMSVR